MQRLSNRYAVYVPSKDKHGVAIDHDAAKQATMEFFCKEAGGATALREADGIWLGSNGEVIAEPIDIVYAYSALDIAQLVVRFAAIAAKDWKQESVAVELPDSLVLVNEEDSNWPF